MHGIVLKGLKDFVVEHRDEDVWDALHEEAGLEKRIYMPVTEYPDEVVLSLVDAAVELTGVDASTLCYEFGRFLLPELIGTYGVHVDRDWTGLDLVANVEEYVHEALRAKRISEFTPPRISSARIDEQRALVAYESDRGLCALAEGVLVGVGEHYDERFLVDQRVCVHDGASHCEFVVRTVDDPRTTEAETTHSTTR